jgi:hypothetical protein
VEFRATYLSPIMVKELARANLIDVGGNSEALLNFHERRVFALIARQSHEGNCGFVPREPENG